MVEVAFKKEDLELVVWDDHESFHKINDKIVSTGRWSRYHEMIFSANDKYYKVTYEMPATEYQETEMFSGLGEDVYCTEVRKITKLIEVEEFIPVDDAP